MKIQFSELYVVVSGYYDEGEVYTNRDEAEKEKERRNTMIDNMWVNTPGKPTARIESLDDYIDSVREDAKEDAEREAYNRINGEDDD